MNLTLKKTGFVLLFCLSLSPWVRSELALLMGLAWALTLQNPFPLPWVKKIQTMLLQGSVIGLGFSVPILTILKLGMNSVPLTGFSIAATFCLGAMLSKIVRLPEKTVALVSAGTAICGGSAIAAVSPAIGAKSEETSMALAVVFILNAIGLLVFPILGHMGGLSEIQFGHWAALAIHDTSSVVGAATSYGPVALATATTVKLVRALWILPVALLLGVYFRKKSHQSSGKKAGFPWFILGFLAASFIASWATGVEATRFCRGLSEIAKHGMIGSIFLIGASLNRKAIRDSGYPVLFLGASLWVMVAMASFFYVKNL